MIWPLIVVSFMFIGMSAIMASIDETPSWIMFNAVGLLFAIIALLYVLESSV